jgi:hypothetical protein
LEEGTQARHNHPERGRNDEGIAGMRAMAAAITLEVID